MFTASNPLAFPILHATALVRMLCKFSFELYFIYLLAELDDGAYNPLWTSRGFTQSFHFWKENRRQQSTPLNAFLTYVTLPWWSIAKGEQMNISFEVLF